MKSTGRLLFLVVALSAAVSSVTSKLSSSIEENPDYVPYESESESNSEYYDDNYDSENEAEEGDEYSNKKSALNRALNETNSKTVKFIHKNRAPLTIACALFAFRREILHIIQSTFTISKEDGSGSRSLRFRISPTAILKIIIFIDVMRKMIGQGHIGDGGPVDMDMVLPGRLGLGGLLLTIMKGASSNTAFIPPVVQHYTFERLQDRYEKDANALRKAVGLESPRRAFRSWSGPDQSITQYNGTTIIMEMKSLDSGVSSMETIRDQITFILNQHAILRKEKKLSLELETKSQQTNVSSTDGMPINDNNASSTESDSQSEAGPKPKEVQIEPETEIVILLESPGGSATDYGLAAQQIWRLRNEPGIKVTICVDKVAASGGYMMACMSSPGCLYAAPFAVVGSIGVIGQTINIHKSLQNWGVQPLVFRGGKDKAPVGLVGEVTKEGLEKVQKMVDKTHVAFKRHVMIARPQIASKINEVATGDVWLAIDAMEHGLVDEITTSDEYIRGKVLNGEIVLKLVKCQRPRFVFGLPHQPYASGSMNILHQSFKAFFDVIQEFGSLLKKMNVLMQEQSVADLSRVASVRVINAGNVQTSMKQ